MGRADFAVSFLPTNTSHFITAASSRLQKPLSTREGLSTRLHLPRSSRDLRIARILTGSNQFAHRPPFVVHVPPADFTGTMSDTYWSRNPEEPDSDGLTGLRGYSPAPGLSAYRMGSQDSLPTLSRQGSGIATGSYGLSPSALDPNNFSAHFSMPRFAQAGPGDAFGYSGVGVVQPTG